MTKVFIDGSAGTTGLRIADRLKERSDIELITLPDADRKDPKKRKEAVNFADICFLCLPDEAAKETVAMVENPDTTVIDTSTAHRVSPDFVYGLPEVLGRGRIKNSQRIANPGCHATGFISLVFPLVKQKIIKPDARLCCFSITGYSGGGKRMIAKYESDGRSALLGAPRQYGLSQQHKHLKEMAAVTGLLNPPVFCPVVGDFYSGMEVTVTLNKSDFSASLSEIEEVYKSFYTGRVVSFSDEQEEGFLSAGILSGKDSMTVSAFGNDDRVILVSRFDNLGKGASGAAVQNMNIVMGIDETEGLVL
mgnify:FL=1